MAVTATVDPIGLGELGQGGQRHRVDVGGDVGQLQDVAQPVRGKAVFVVRAGPSAVQYELGPGEVLQCWGGGQNALLDEAGLDRLNG